MRNPEYISPTSLMLFYKDRQEFYLKYLADKSPPKIPQTTPMALGSGFDARVKSYISLVLKLNLFDFHSLFEQQVEPQNRDDVYKISKEIFEEYKRCGAMADIMRDIEDADSEPIMEDDVRKPVLGIKLRGKPDLFYRVCGVPVNRDWKVNGYFSKQGMSPAKGYIHRYDKNCSHKDAVVHIVNGVKINVAQKLEEKDESWATQLAIYGWLAGAKVGEDFYAGIDQLSFRSGKQCCSRHMEIISGEFQLKLYQKIENMRKIIDSGHIFDDLSREESGERCRTLDSQHLAFAGTGDNKLDKFMQQCAGR